MSDYRNSATPTALARFASLPTMILAYQKAEATIRATFRLLVDAEADLNTTFQIDKNDHAHFRIDASRGMYRSSFDEPDAAVDLIKRQAWRAIVDRLEMRRIVSRERWREIEEMLDKGDLPPVSEESVGAWAQGFMDRLPEMLEESIKEAFEYLRPRSEEMRKMKTNSEMEIPRKVIVNWVSVGFHGLELSHYYEQHAIAVERVFQALDGRGSIAKSHWSELHGAIKESKATGYRGETTWFKFRACKKGTLHLECRRLDLLDRFNKIAGGMRLRPETRRGVAVGEGMEIST